MKTKPNLTRIGGIYGTLRFGEKFFFNFLLRFTPYWDYKPTNAIHAYSPGVYTTDENLILNTQTKIHLNCICIDATVSIGLR